MKQKDTIPLASKRIHDTVARAVDAKRISSDPKRLNEYAGSQSFLSGSPPLFIVTPKDTHDVKNVIEAANKTGFSVLASSSGMPKLRGDTVPRSDNCVILDMREMNRILRVDQQNKVAMVEAGVTFDQLVAETRKHGLRPLMPLLPKASKSVVAACLDREPITMPKYHWDSSDPLLCTETVFGSGDVFRTGAAAGPGSLEEQWESGQAQKNPLGPSQFDPFRLIQGSQGTIGVVTWATVKCETLPSVQRAYFVGSDTIEPCLNFLQPLLKRRLGDDLLIVDRTTLAAALKKSPTEIESMRRSLPPWITILTMSGKGNLAQDEIDYVDGDVKDIARAAGVRLVSSLGPVTAENVLSLLGRCSEDPYWKLRLRSGCQEVFFLTTLEKIPSMVSAFAAVAKSHGFSESYGTYVQPAVQGCSFHVEFDMFYDATDSSERERARTLYSEACESLLSRGAYFSRPYGPFVDRVYEKSSAQTRKAMRTVKSIFDPHGVLNPGALCFKEVNE